MYSTKPKNIIAFPLLLIFSVFMILGIHWTIISLSTIICISFDNELSWQDHLFLLIFSIILTLLYFAKLINFVFFPQAYELYKTNKDLLFWFSQKNLHAVRYLIAYPAVMISDIGNMTLNEAFTIYTCMAFNLICFLLFKLLKRLHGLTDLNRIISISLLVLLSFAMNGRLIYAFLGIILILEVEYKFMEDSTGILPLKFSEIIGLILTMVSSGTMTVTAVFLLVMSLIQWKERKRKKEKYGLIFVNLILIFPLLSKFFPYLIRFLIKNTDYYGGGFYGFIGAMQHGFGRFFYTSNAKIYILLAVSALLLLSVNALLFIYFVICKKNKYLPIFLIMNICIYGGIFGFSTALLGLLPVMVLILSKYFKHIKI